MIDLNLRYIKPAHFGQWLTVSAELVEWEHRLKIKYLVMDKDNHTRLTKGYSIQVAVNNETQEMCFVSPNILLEKLEAARCG